VLTENEGILKKKERRNRGFNGNSRIEFLYTFIE
jgi:hypothetical protein